MPNNRLILAVDDLEPGLLVTIHGHRSRRVPLESVPGSSEAPLPPIQIVSNGEGPNLPNGGVPLRVLAVACPYVACVVIQPDGEEAGPLMIDTRLTRLMRLDPKFLEAILEFGRRRTAEAGAADQPDSEVDEVTARFLAAMAHGGPMGNKTDEVSDEISEAERHPPGEDPPED